MKKSVLLMSMALALTAFGSDMQIAKAAEETASKEEIKVEDLVGSYTAIATYNSGYYVSIEATGMDSILEVSEGLASWQAEAWAMILEKYGLKNDDTHLVIDDYGVITCYDAEKNAVYQYIPAISEEEAEKIKVQYSRTASYESVEIEDNVVVIVDTSSDVDLEYLEGILGDYKIETE